jgi:hypothetical protein
MNSEVGMRKVEFKNKTQIEELGIRTRRRPIGRDYAAANDADVGKKGRHLSSPKGFRVDLFLFESFFEKKQSINLCPKKYISMSHNN